MIYLNEGIYYFRLAITYFITCSMQWPLTKLPQHGCGSAGIPQRFCIVLEVPERDWETTKIRSHIPMEWEPLLIARWTCRLWHKRWHLGHRYSSNLARRLHRHPQDREWLGEVG